ncbi:nickel pincer cofactor biosynthesis protein LarC [Caloranaerobacter azorensis]|uniref:Pyridinium-3,5-bisthiocarboxylic acid mononucleotide nickel insertion protein n=1 Tax=Caloranaerobacter azorensis TaxID=116090 RepID=A0A6P1YE49_9FIRM|nr:nickel pincer cofactor biosynthesis protein LarC [Caloranaerobacter azorensis]QIB27043.1 nickel pincer cofactor biosynthesis protein LarC [Caloranaerobacter azorensis]
MKILYYDCFSGISGDMNLGAMIDLGVDKEYLINELSKLNLDSEYEIRIRRENKKGIDGTKVDVILKNKYDHSHNHTHSHTHRNLKDIEDIINSSSLNENVKKLSIDMFIKIAQAEAKVHGKSLYEVHFHEVGAVDSIVDIVGAAICIDYLKVDKIMASHVQVGGGFVNCAHGLIPVPAPATVEILKGIPIKSGLVPFETTTPTGAAILAVNVDEFTDEMNFTIEKIGYGIGSRDLKIPNVLRVYIARENEKKTEYDLHNKQYILETNIDDMNPEIYSYIEKKLFDKGALDVFRTPIIMKKGRMAVKLSVLVNEKDIKAIQEVIFRETTSIGIRKYEVEKIMLKRDFSKIITNYGEVTVKNSYYKGERIKSKPEYEDCRRLAEENNVPIGEIYREVYKRIGDVSNDK